MIAALVENIAIARSSVAKSVINFFKGAHGREMIHICCENMENYIYISSVKFTSQKFELKEMRAIFGWMCASTLIGQCERSGTGGFRCYSIM